MYRSYYPPVHAYLRRRVGPERAEDLAAEVFTTVWRKIEFVPLEDEALPWLYRIAHLTTSNHWRSINRKANLQKKLDSIEVHEPPTVDDQIVVREEVRDALELLRRLKPADQEILKLSLWEQLDHNEIGAVLDLAPDAVRQRLHRARKRLASLYESTKDANKPPAAQKGGGW